MKPKLHPSSVELLQSTPGNSKLLGKSMKVPGGELEAFNWKWGNKLMDREGMQ